MEVDEPDQVQDNAPAAGPPEGEAGKKKRFEVKKWNAVALWYALMFFLAVFFDDFSCVFQSVLHTCIFWVRTFFRALSRILCYFFVQGLGHCGGQLRDLSQPHHGSLH